MKHLLFFCLSIISLSAWAQDGIIQSDTLFNFIYTKNGNVYRANKIEQDSLQYHFNDFNAGNISLKKLEVQRIEPVLQHMEVVVHLADNTIYSGTITNSDREKLSILSNDNLLTLNFGNITSIEFRPATVKNFNKIGNPNATRYLFAPSAIPIKKGSGYYQNAYIFSNSANYGLTSSISVGGGIVLPVLFYVTPKISKQILRNTYIGAGFIYTTTFLPEVKFGAGIPYGLFTYGSEENNFTIGSGYGFIWTNGKANQTPYPIVTINGMKRLTNKLQLVSENWFIPFKYTEYIYAYDPVTGYYSSSEEVTSDRYIIAASLGLRLLFTEKSSIDFAPVYINVNNSNLVLPYLDFVYKF